MLAFLQVVAGGVAVAAMPGAPGLVFGLVGGARLLVG